LSNSVKLLLNVYNIRAGFTSNVSIIKPLSVAMGIMILYSILPMIIQAIIFGVSVYSPVKPTNSGLLIHKNQKAI